MLKGEMKLYHSISEVAEMFKVNESLLRYWEKKFPTLKPKKNRRGARLYMKEDIERIELIYHLVKVKGMTLAGARKKMTHNKEVTLSCFDLLQHLKNIKAELLAMRKELDQR
ncbi:MAG TPA: MerR family transcriptional regulator [Bacteroides coprosuis]|nr:MULTISPECIES: MerR family transcriptional regulator [Bacteroides]HJD91104.1 MerR family transcriptional regulator [Bacteroides coprosuis]